MEKLIRNRMQGLSSSVDCFDKISEKAFDGKRTYYTEEGYSVNDLEKVTSRRRKHPVIKWAAAAAAVLVIIGIIPKTAQVNRQRTEHEAMTANIETYQGIAEKITDISRAPEGYVTYEFPLDTLLENDILINPLFTCPFEASTKKDIKVRYYVRICNSCLTNEVYAVEYTDTFAESNFIAAASSGQTFTREDLEKFQSNNFDTDDELSFPNDFISLVSKYESYSDEYVGAHFSSGNKDFITDSSGDEVYLATYASPTYYKTESGEVIKLLTGVEYYQSVKDGKFYYSTFNLTDSKTVDLSKETRIGGWKDSVYHNGKPSVPREASRRYQLAVYDSEKPLSRIISISPLDYPNQVYSRRALNSIRAFNNDGKLISEMDLPFGDEMINSARIYLPDSFLPANDSSKSSIAILSSGDENFSFAVSMDNIHIPEFSTASD